METLKMDLLYISFLILLGSSSSNKVDGIRAEKIVGGSLARRHEFKHVVAVMYKSPGLPDRNPCAGSIVGDLFIATVAHCFYDKLSRGWRKAYFYIIVGTKQVSESSSLAWNIRVDKVTIPKTYNPEDSDSYDTSGNLAIVKLKEKLGLGPNYLPWKHLLIRRQNLNNFTGTFRVAAYGYHMVNLVQKEINGILQYTQDGETDGKLRYTRVDIIEDTECFNILADILAPGNMCVRAVQSNPEKPVGICKFDSGAPISHGHYLDGLAINGFMECAENIKPAIYIDILYYSEFISDVLDGIRTKKMYVLKLMKDGHGQFEFKRI